MDKIFKHGLFGLADKLFGKEKGKPVEATNPNATNDLDQINQAANQTTQTVRMKKGGKVSSASSRADGCCVKGKTKGRMV